ncbi:hypothetical protein D3C87_1403110 [compost metagenome]
MPFGQISVDEGFEWLFSGEDLCAQLVDLYASLLQGFLYQFVFGLEVRVKATVGQTQCFHQRLQSGRADTVASKSR